MYNISTLVKSLEAQFSADESVVASEVIRHQIAISVAYAIPLCQEETTDGRSAFIQHRADVKRMLSDINEYFVIDIDKTLDAVRNLFIKRWDLVFNPRNCLELFAQVAADSVTSDTSPEAVAMVRSAIDQFKGDNLVSIATQVCQYLEQLKTERTQED